MKIKKVFWMLVLTALLAAGTCWAVECPEQIPDLVSYWKFDEGAGGTAYDTVNNNDGKVIGAEWTAGQIAGALEFYGNSERVNCGKDSSLYMGNAMTLSVWVKPSNKGGGVRRFMERGYYSNSSNNKNIYLAYHHDSGKLQYRIRHDHNIKLISTSAAADVWQHVTATYNSGTMKLYVNGQFAGQKTGADLQPAVSNYDLYLGSEFAPHPPAHSFDGAMDDVAFFNRALTEDEAMEIYLDGMDGHGLALDHRMVAIINIKKAIDVKNEAIAVVEVAIIEERTSLAALEALQDCDDPGLTPRAIHVAIQRITQSIGRQENIKIELFKSIRELNRALTRLGCPQGNCI